MTKRLVLLVSHEMSLSGAPQSLLRQARCLRDRGYDVRVWTVRSGPLEDVYHAEGFPVEVVPFNRRRVVDMAKVLGPALAVCNTFRTYQFADVLASMRMPTVWFVRETGDLAAPFAHDLDFRRVLTGFYNIYTVSDYAREVIARYNANVRYFNNSVPDDFRGFASFSPVLRFGFIGSVVRRKGLRELLAAFHEAFGSRDDVSLVVAGKVAGSEEAETLKSEFANMQSVSWLGEVSGSDRRTFFDSIDVLCMPSLDEPSGLSLLEGAMYGKVLLATENVGAKYVICDANGIVVPVSRLAHGLLRLYECRAELPIMQRESRRMYLACATPERECVDVLKMVEQNINNRPPDSWSRSRPIRQLFKKTDVDADHWRFFVWGFPVLSCRKCRWAKKFFKRILLSMGINPVCCGFSTDYDVGGKSHPPGHPPFFLTTKRRHPCK